MSTKNWLQLLFVVIISIIPSANKAQSIPVGSLINEDYYRRIQLLGELDSTISFNLRPIYHSAITYRDILTGSQNTNRNINQLQATLIDKHKFRIQLMPFTWQNQYTTHHPIIQNDGAMIPAKGFQTMVSGGIYGQLGPLSVQLMPEYIYAQNLDFKGFERNKSNQAWIGYYNINNKIDLPEKFGTGPYKRTTWGQSSIRLNVGPLSAGLSNENIWWGPGINNSFIMSNSAPGFKHLTFNSTRPVKTFLGSFEGQLIGGRLEDSGFAPVDTNYVIINKKLYVAKRPDWRYINGLMVSYQPKWVPGLFLGAARTYISYYKDMGHSVRDFLPVFSALSKKANYGQNEAKVENDQRASIFVRWIWQKENAELYWEFGRDDHAYNLRDYFLEPEHDRTYVFGFRKLMPINKLQGQYIQFNIELAQFINTSADPERTNMPIYTHWYLRQGYTNDGQMLGNGMMPNDNLQIINLSWIKSYNSIGIKVERDVHNAYDTYIMDSHTKWVDFRTTAYGEWKYQQFLISLKFEIMRSYNYQNTYVPIMLGNSPFYWDPGRDVYNYQAKVGITYLF